METPTTRPGPASSERSSPSLHPFPTSTTTCSLAGFVPASPATLLHPLRPPAVEQHRAREEPRSRRIPPSPAFSCSSSLLSLIPLVFSLSRSTNGHHHRQRMQHPAASSPDAGEPSPPPPLPVPDRRRSATRRCRLSSETSRAVPPHLEPLDLVDHSHALVQRLAGPLPRPSLLPPNPASSSPKPSGPRPTR